MKSWIQTYSGVETDFEFDYEHPESFTWPLVSVAHHLAYICRYTGAVRRFYSVAEHVSRVSLYAADLVRFYRKDLSEEGLANESKAAARAGLVHDFSEAVFGDVNSPLKNMPYMHGYKLAEESMHPIVAKRFNTHKVFVTYAGESWDVVRCADLQALEFERVQLLGKPPHPWRANHILPVVESKAFFGELGYPPENAEATLLHLAGILGIE